jgi:hypothetical protein
LDNDLTNLDVTFDPTDVERSLQFESVFKEVAPKIKSHAGQLIVTQILLVLRLEGIVGEKLSKSDLELVDDIKNKLVNNKDVLEDTLKQINQIIRG